MSSGRNGARSRRRRGYLTEEQQDEDGHEDVKVVGELALQPGQEPGLEKLVPGPRRQDRQHQQQDDGQLGVEDAGHQGPLQAHFFLTIDFDGKLFFTSAAAVELLFGFG